MTTAGLTPPKTPVSAQGVTKSAFYKANPFILLNWTDKLYSTYVLAHESGHAMHSWFSQHHQPAQYADAPSS
ncbi:M3 family metallopeptidase [Limosilactobacillus fermentum]|uniref:M3 family metallopeptidase n=1 Tax=Limosilactobacillus fermentum TaxID=1613 RepID=UPI0021F1EA55|nr:M3 family metallopeptidase [Limosilactobacillus fermentum]